jgi:predicted neuraminidase
MKLFFLTSCALGSALLGCAAPATNDTPVLRKQAIFETAPFPSCHASTLAETKDGLIAAFFGGTHERHPDVCIYVSRLESGRWTPPQEVADGTGFSTNRLPTWNPVLFQPRTGPLPCFTKSVRAPARGGA